MRPGRKEEDAHVSQQVFVPAAGQPAASAKNGCNRIGLTRPDFEHEQATWGQMLFSFSRQPPVKGKAVRTAIQGFNLEPHERRHD
jgi:hypothetical protein